MGSCYYFLPGVMQFQIADLLNFGLDIALEDITSRDQLAVADGATGPSGTAGALISAWRPGCLAPPDMRYLPQLQVWQQLPGELAWIGWHVNTAPTPDGLRRKAPLVSGIDVRLGDGQLWQVPVIRYPAGPAAERIRDGRLVAEGTLLPQKLVMHSDGHLSQRILPSDQELWNQFEPVANWIWRSDEEGQLTRLLPLSAQVLAAAAALSRNYRVCAVTGSALGLWDTETLVRLLAAAVGLDLQRDLIEEKKTA